MEVKYGAMLRNMMKSNVQRFLYIHLRRASAREVRGKLKSVKLVFGSAKRCMTPRWLPVQRTEGYTSLASGQQ